MVAETQIQALAAKRVAEIDLVKLSPGDFLNTIAKLAVEVKNFIVNSFGGEIPVNLEELVRGYVIGALQERFKGDNPNVPNWFEPTLEAGLIKLAEIGISYVFAQIGL